MNPDQLESLLTAFETDVRYPDSNGMEHLDMLLTRNRLENERKLLTAGQLNRLTDADRMLTGILDAFAAAIGEIGDLSDWREA